MFSEPVITIGELGTRYVDIWLSFYDEMTDDALLAHLRSLLSEKELLQEARFHFADGRKRYLGTRALVRSVFSRYAPVHPASWEFCVNAYGRPQIVPPHDDEAQGLRFNVSHTWGLIALGVARDRDVGIDVENLTVRDIPAGLAERWFTPEEVTELKRTERGRRQEKFFEYWTLKEAYIKACGMGLSIPLNQFSFRDPQPEIVRIAIGPEPGDDPARWAFWHCVRCDLQNQKPPFIARKPGYPGLQSSIFNRRYSKPISLPEMGTFHAKSQNGIHVSRARIAISSNGKAVVRQPQGLSSLDGEAGSPSPRVGRPIHT